MAKQRVQRKRKQIRCVDIYRAICLKEYTKIRFVDEWCVADNPLELGTFVNVHYENDSLDKSFAYFIDNDANILEAVRQINTHIRELADRRY